MYRLQSLALGRHRAQEDPLYAECADRQTRRLGALTFAPPSPALEAKKVVIVGAGPAGLEAVAAMLAEHGVKNLAILSRRAGSGGKINLAQIPPLKANTEFDRLPAGCVKNATAESA